MCIILAQFVVIDSWYCCVRYDINGEPALNTTKHFKWFKDRIKTTNVELIFNNQFVTNVVQPGTTGLERCNQWINGQLGHIGTHDTRAFFIDIINCQFAWNWLQIKLLIKNYTKYTNLPVNQRFLSMVKKIYTDVEQLTMVNQEMNQNTFYVVNTNAKNIIDDQIVKPRFKKYNLQATNEVKFQGKHQSSLYDLLVANNFNVSKDQLVKHFNGMFDVDVLVMYCRRWNSNVY